MAISNLYNAYKSITSKLYLYVNKRTYVINNKTRYVFNYLPNDFTLELTKDTMR